MSSSTKAEYSPNDLFEAGGVFLFFDFPLNSEFGIDYNSWRTDEKFRGVKMIPSGFHFIYFSVSDKYGSLGLRSGFFHNFKVQEVVAKRWNRELECIEDYPMSEDQVENFRHSKREYDKFMGAYPYDEYKRWLSLTNNLNETLLTRLAPETGIITSEQALVGQTFTKGKQPGEQSESPTKSAKLNESELESKVVNTDILEAPKSMKEAESRLPRMEAIKSASLRFSKIPTELYPPGSTSTQVTHFSIDMSFRLETLLRKQSEELGMSELDPFNLLCELQFTFVCFLIGHVYDAFEQWKTLTSLLCNSETLIEQHPAMYAQFVQVLYFQIKEVPEDFFTDIVTSNNFLAVNLHNLFDNIREVSARSGGGGSGGSGEIAKRLHEKCDRFKGYLQAKFGLDFEEEPDEYAPVVCEE
jgi:A1 cistron-splicing factor AAR2